MIGLKEPKVPYSHKKSAPPDLLLRLSTVLLTRQIVWRFIDNLSVPAPAPAPSSLHHNPNFMGIRLNSYKNGVEKEFG